MSASLHFLKPATLFAIYIGMRNLFILLISLVSMSGLAQEKINSVGEQLEEVRYMAFELNDYPKAIDLAKKGVVNFPQSQEISIFLCRLFFWSEKSVPAIHYIDRHLINFPQDKDAHLLKIDILESQQEFEASLDFISSIEEKFEGDQMLKYRKAYTQSVLGETQTSIQMLEEIVGINPEFEKANTLLSDIKSQNTKQYIATGYHLFRPVNELVSMSQYELSYGKQVNKSTYVAQVNIREIQSERGLQGQLEWYRKINKHFYTHTHFAYSDSDLLANYRFGLGGFWEYDNGLQLSGTFTRMIADTRAISIFSAGILKRFDNLALSSKFYYVDNPLQNSDFSYLFGLRRYLNDNDMYAGITFGFIPQYNILVLQQSESILARFIGFEFAYPHKKEYEFKFQYNLNLQKFALQRDQLMLNLKYYF